MKKSILVLVFLLSASLYGCKLPAYSSNAKTTFIESNSEEQWSFFEESEEPTSSYSLSESSFECTQDEAESTSANFYFDPFYGSQIESKMLLLSDLKSGSEEYDVFTFYTDHHCFMPNGSFEVDRDLLESHFDLIQKVQDLSDSSFTMCGGDLLNYGDSRSQACYKLSLYFEEMNQYLKNPHFVVGNHDTNCQGNTYNYENSYDYSSCMLSQDTINDIFFNGQPSYYCFEVDNTSCYCFDSGIDWFALNLSEYQQEQLGWFAGSLLEDHHPYKNIFVHMALFSHGSAVVVTSLMSEVGRIIEAFNSRSSVIINNVNYDYSSSVGTIEFIQSGHLHSDVNSFECGGVPIVVTTSFAAPEAVSRPTFDVVFVDHSNHKVNYLRIGDGEDRVFEMQPLASPFSN